ncbi:MAG: hypothetical protein AAF443_01805 [Chlamydiota bacterium]
MAKIIGGGFIGAVIAFIWMWVSWTVLPWHDWAFQSFEHEDFIGWVIKENTAKDGVYTIPGMDVKGKTKKEREESIEKQRKMLREGPFIYLHVNKEGMNPMSPRRYIVSFLTQFVGAAIASFLLLQCKETSRYGKRFAVVLLFGVGVAVLAVVPRWNWFATGSDYALVMIADYVATWFLVALALAGLVKPKRSVTRPM